jgi:hypothetical protein
MAILKKTTVVAKPAAKPAAKAAAKPMSNSRLQQKAMDKIAAYSNKASRGEFGVNNAYFSGGERVSPTDSVMKYSNELKKLRKKK